MNQNTFWSPHNHLGFQILNLRSVNKGMPFLESRVFPFTLNFFSNFAGILTINLNFP